MSRIRQNMPPNLQNPVKGYIWVSIWIYVRIHSWLENDGYLKRKVHLLALLILLCSLQSLLFIHPSIFAIHTMLSWLYPFHCVAHPLPILLFACVSCFSCSTKYDVRIGKMPQKYGLVVRGIVEQGVTFPRKCHCRHADPRYWAGRIDHLYDTR